MVFHTGSEVGLPVHLVILVYLIEVTDVGNKIDDLLGPKEWSTHSLSNTHHHKCTTWR